jgi:16S rRNA (guanine527-N7)-methyltransferase
LPPTAHEAASRADDLLVAGANALGIPLDIDTIAAFRVYREDLIRWSQRMNLTALATPAQIVQQGLLDSLACAPLLPTTAGRVIDIGSGAGFPAVPLALVRPEIEFSLVEPSRKKVTFLRHVIRQLNLRRVRIHPNRAEALLGESGMLGAFDVGLARAVAPLPEIGRLVLPFLRPGGIFLAQTGPAEHVQAGIYDLAECGLEVVDERVVPPEFGKTGRRILALRKAPDRQPA